MFKRNLLAAISVGLALSFQALAQGAVETAIEDQAVSEPQQQQSASAGQIEAAPEAGPPQDIAPFLQGIEAAIRDLIAEEDEIHRQDQEARESRDLDAQEAMAKWAMWMFWATLGTVVLTLAALIAILRTLHHTRRAADYTGQMVTQAEATTKAAQESVEEARKATKAAQAGVRVSQKIGEAQVRAYVSIVGSSLEIERERRLVKATVEVKNYGNSPARQIHVRYRFGVHVNHEGWRSQLEFAPIDKTYAFGHDLSAGETATLNFLSNFALTQEEVAAIGSAFVNVDAVVRIEFTDVFGREVIEDQFRSCMIQAVGQGLPFYRVPFNQFEMQRMADSAQQGDHTKGS